MSSHQSAFPRIEAGLHNQQKSDAGRVSLSLFPLLPSLSIPLSVSLPLSPSFFSLPLPSSSHSLFPSLPLPLSSPSLSIPLSASFSPPPFLSTSFFSLPLPFSGFPSLSVPFPLSSPFLSLSPHFPTSLF
jgi:hypothetical protein